MFTSWTETLLEPTSVATNTLFGTAASLNGDGTVLAVGALIGTGTVYVYQRPPGDSDAWTLHRGLQASGGANGDAFGYDVSLSLSGLTLVVGAYKRDAGGTIQAGAVYFFTRTSTSSSSWSQTYHEEPEPRASNDYYGFSVALSGELHAAVGARYRDTGGLGNAGAMFVLDRASLAANSWSEVELSVSVPVSSAELGRSVDISEDGLTVVGSLQFADVEVFSRAGSVVVFTRPSIGGAFSQSVVVSPEPATNEYFGNAVALSADGLALLVGASSNGDVADNAGKAHLFSRSSASSHAWARTDAFVPVRGQRNDFFGDSVALDADGSTRVVGAYGTMVSGTVNAGAVFVSTQPEDARLSATPSAVSFDRVLLGNTPSQQVQISVYAWDATVSSISIVGVDASDFVIVSGDTSAAELPAPTSRAVVIELQSQTVGAKRAALRIVSDAPSSPLDVALSAFVVAAPVAPGSSVSVASLARKLHAVDAAPNSNFGSSVSFDTFARTLAVGAAYDDAVGSNVGAVYVYTRTDPSVATWATETKITPPGGTSPSTHFG